jgi:Basic region leucine zipper
MSDMNPGSVQSSTNSQDDDYESACSSQHESRPKRRGRPPKPIESRPMSPSEYSHLSEADWKYRELRNKNNEASRRSRQNRKAKESTIECEANEMTRRYRVLEVQERKLIKQCAKWRKAVMALALI